jgi:hypothetical protein
LNIHFIAGRFTSPSPARPPKVSKFRLSILFNLQLLPSQPRPDLDPKSVNFLQPSSSVPTLLSRLLPAYTAIMDAQDWEDDLLRPDQILHREDEDEPKPKKELSVVSFPAIIVDTDGTPLTSFTGVEGIIKARVTFHAQPEHLSYIGIDFASWINKKCSEAASIKITSNQLELTPLENDTAKKAPTDVTARASIDLTAQASTDLTAQASDATSDNLFLPHQSLKNVTKTADVPTFFLEMDSNLDLNLSRGLYWRFDLTLSAWPRHAHNVFIILTYG